eukprot:gene23450-biopygen23833
MPSNEHRPASAGTTAPPWCVRELREGCPAGGRSPRRRGRLKAPGGRGGGATPRHPRTQREKRRCPRPIRAHIFKGQRPPAVSGGGLAGPFSVSRERAARAARGACPVRHRFATVHSPQSTVHSPQSTVHSPQSTVHSPQSIKLDSTGRALCGSVTRFRSGRNSHSVTRFRANVARQCVQPLPQQCVQREKRQRTRTGRGPDAGPHDRLRSNGRGPDAGWARAQPFLPQTACHFRRVGAPRAAAALGCARRRAGRCRVRLPHAFIGHAAATRIHGARCGHTHSWGALRAHAFMGRAAGTRIH